MRGRRRPALGGAVLVGILLIALIATIAVAGHSSRQSRRKSQMNPIAPTLDDLAQASRSAPEHTGRIDPVALVAGADGITVLCTATARDGSEHTCLIRLSNDGSMRWTRHYPGELGSGRAMAALPSGGLVIAGDVRRAALELQASMLTVDREGQVGKSAAFGPPGVTGFQAVAASPDGSMIAGGMADWKGWLVRLDPTLRATSQQRFDELDEINGLAALPGGGFAMIGSEQKSTTAFGLTRLGVFGADGIAVWQRQLPTTGRGEPAALAIAFDGSLLASGHGADSERHATRSWVARASTVATLAWQRWFGRVDEEQRGRAIAAMPEGGIAIAGDAMRAGSRGLRVVRLASDGTTLWEREFGGGSDQDDLARGLARTEDGGLLLVASTRNGPGVGNVWVLRLDRTGDLLWQRTIGPTIQSATDGAPQRP
jgi:hypothetical protein